MDKQGTPYTFIFALIACAILSVALSAVSEGLRPRKELNEALDIKKNILKSVKLETPLSDEATPDEMLDAFKTKIEQVVLDGEGNIVDGKLPEDIKEDGTGFYPLYIYKEGSEVKAYSFPIVGKGLWSTMYGYLSLEPDAETVRGITFYKHGETPGLGAEIETEWFQANFEGKKIWDEQEKALNPIAVLKGKVTDTVQDQYQQQFYVDGISGATMTTKGVTEMLDRWLNAYEPFFVKKRVM